MTKAELITAIADRTGISKKQAEEALAALTESITEALAQGHEVSLPGLGKLSVTDRPARQGRNPATGEAIEIAARKAPAFKASQTLKDAVNK